MAVGSTSGCDRRHLNHVIRIQARPAEYGRLVVRPITQVIARRLSNSGAGPGHESGLGEDPLMTAGRYWMRLSRFLTTAAS
jgi:hypothetical protein